MLLLLRERPNGPVYIEYVPSFERGEIRAKTIDAATPRQKTVRIIQGSRGDLSSVHKALAAYKIRDTNWFRTWKGQPVVAFWKSSAGATFDAGEWARGFLERKHRRERKEYFEKALAHTLPQSEPEDHYVLGDTK